MSQDNYWLRRAQGGSLSRRRFVGGAAMAGVGAAGLGLVGCGDDSTTSTPTKAPAGNTAAAGASPSAAAATVVKGGISRGVYLGATVYDSVDVHRAFGDPSSWLSNYVLNKVIRFKNPDTGELEGDIADTWEAPDASTYTFKLRKDIKWQNTPLTNGRALTAQDVRWHFERQVSGKTAAGADTVYRFASIYKGIKIETPDEYTIKLTLPSPNGGFLARLASFTGAVPNRETTEKFEADHRTITEEAMPASGAFTLKQWRAGKDILFVKNPGNFRKGEPNLDGIIVPQVFEDPNAARAAFEQKQLDFWASPDASLTKSVIAKNKDAMAETLTGVANTVYLHLNMNQQFKDVRLVRAMNMAVDRRLMIQTFHQGLGQVSGAVSWLQEGYAIKPDDLIKLPGYRTDREIEKKEARALWAAGGGPALGDVDIKVEGSWSALWPDTSQVVVKMFNESLGVTQFKSTKTSYTEEIIPNLANGTFPNWTAWTGQVTSPDPRSDLHSGFHSKGATNFQKVNNPELDKLLDESVGAVDLAKAVEASRKAQAIIIENGHYGNVVLYNYIYPSAQWNYFHGGQKVLPAPGKPGSGYNLFAGHLVAKNVYIDTKDPTFQGRPSVTI